MTQISITAESSNRASLLGARAVIDRLLENSADPTADASIDARNSNESEQPEGELAQRFVDDLWARTGDGHHELILQMASFDGLFSLADISTKTGDPLSKTHSRVANLGRSMEAARKSVQDAPDLLIEHEQVDGLWHFSMSESIRNAVRQVAEK